MVALRHWSTPKGTSFLTRQEYIVFFFFFIDHDRLLRRRLHSYILLLEWFLGGFAAFSDRGGSPHTLSLIIRRSRSFLLPVFQDLKTEWVKQFAPHFRDCQKILHPCWDSNLRPSDHNDCDVNHSAMRALLNNVINIKKNFYILWILRYYQLFFTNFFYFYTKYININVKKE